MPRYFVPAGGKALRLSEDFPMVAEEASLDEMEAIWQKAKAEES